MEPPPPYMEKKNPDAPPMVDPGYGATTSPPPPVAPAVAPQTVIMAPTQTIGVVTSPLFMLTTLPASIQCPHCLTQVVTSIKMVPGLLTYLACGGSAMVGCWLGCCLIPFCIDDCLDVEHSCPNCHALIHIYKRIK